MTNIQYPPTIKQSSAYLRGKYKLTELQQKLVTLGMARVQADSTGGLSAIVRASEIRALTGAKGSGIYSQLLDLADAIQNQRILIKNDETKEFESTVIIPKCSYLNGDFYMEFHKDLKKHIMGYQKPYIYLRMDTVLDLSLYASRLFGILKSYVAYPFIRGKREMDVEIGLNEIKFELGIYDPEMAIRIPSGVKNVNGKMKTIYRKTKISKEIKEGRINWDEAVSYIAKENHRYDNWYSFKRRILAPACEEISRNAKSDITCEIEPRKAGRGAKVVAVVFHVRKDVNYRPAELLREERNIIITQLQALMKDERLSVEELEKICESGEWDYNYIEETYALAKRQAHIKNFVGWMRDALKNHYIDSAPVETMSGKTQEEIEILNEMVEEAHDPEVRKAAAKRVRKRKSILDNIDYKENPPEEEYPEEEPPREDDELLMALKGMSKERRKALLEALRENK